MSDYDDDEVTVVSMNETTVPTAEQIRADVLDRRTFIGGSDAPVILGLSAWKTPFELWQEKTGEKEPDDLSEVERVQWGIRLEAVVAEAYMAKTGKKVRRVNNRIVAKDPDDFPCVAQIDRKVVGGGILEIKTTDASQAGEWGAEGTDDIPANYYAQIQHQMACTGAFTAEVAVLIGGNRMRLYAVNRDDEFIENMIAAERNFWHHVVNKIPPSPITWVEANQRWASAPDKKVLGDMEDARIAAELVEVKKELDALSEREEALELKLKQSIQDIGDVLMVNGTEIASWKVQTYKRLDTKRLEAEYPDVAAACRKESTSRVFRLLKGAASFRSQA